MKNTQLKCYALLLAYDLENIIEKQLKFLENEGQNKLASCLANVLKRNRVIDIYIWAPNWDKILNRMQLITKLLFNNTVSSPSDIFVFFDSHHVKSEILGLELFSKRFLYLLNKYFNLSFFYLRINESYLELKKYHTDIEIGTEEFYNVTLKKMTNGRDRITSAHGLEDIKRSFHEAKVKTTTIHNFIFENLPFSFFEEISTSNQNKINLFFQRKLATELLPYLNFTSMSKTEKQRILGMAFSFVGFIDNQVDFIKHKNLKKPNDEFGRKDYEEYLRTEGYNVLKFL